MATVTIIDTDIDSSLRREKITGCHLNRVHRVILVSLIWGEKELQIIIEIKIARKNFLSKTNIRISER